jgi:hypothetical protein
VRAPGQTACAVAQSQERDAVGQWRCWAWHNGDAAPEQPPLCKTAAQSAIRSDCRAVRVASPLLPCPGTVLFADAAWIGRRPRMPRQVPSVESVPTSGDRSLDVLRAAAARDPSSQASVTCSAWWHRVVSRAAGVIIGRASRSLMCQAIQLSPVDHTATNSNATRPCRIHICAPRASRAPPRSAAQTHAAAQYGLRVLLRPAAGRSRRDPLR